MKHAVVLSLILLFAVVGSAAAEEDDAETRYHEAYVQEVIDGKVAEAAKTYLALLEDESTPPRIRAESRFRFAVCAVLLGRADEARAQLAALLADGTTPPIVKAKAEAYQSSIAGLDVGSELERKLQSLVFDLGRVDEFGDVDAYRDFEIIGDRAIPFLQKLFLHQDPRLRRHAFRLLVRLGAEGMASAWSPDLGLSGASWRNELFQYVRSHPEERDALERRLLALDDEALSKHLDHLASSGPFTPDFVTKLVARPGVRHHAVAMLGRVVDADRRYELILDLLRAKDPALQKAVWSNVIWAPDLVADEDARYELLLSWLRSEDPEIANSMADKLLTNAELLPASLDGVVYPLLVRYARRLGGLWYRDAPRRGRRNDHRTTRLTALSDAQPAAAILDALAGIVEEGTAPGEDGEYRRRGLLTHGLADLIATSLEQRPLAEIDLEGYTAVAKRWASVFPPAFPRDTGKQHVPDYPPSRYWTHLRWLLENLPAERADALGRWIVDEVVRQRQTELGDRAYHYLQVFSTTSAGAVRRWHAALEATRDEEVRAHLMKYFPRVSSAATPEVKRAFVSILPDLLRVVDHQLATALVSRLNLQTDEMEPAEAVEAVTAMVRAIAGRPADLRAEVYDELGSPGIRESAPELLSYLTRIWPEVVRRVYSDLPAEDRKLFLKSLYRAWYAWPGNPPVVDPELVAFLHEHLGEEGTDWEVVARHPAEFPLTTWVPIAPEHAIQSITHSVNHRIIFTEAQTDEAARELTKDPTKVNESIFAFVIRCATNEVRVEILDHLLASGSSAARGLVLSKLERPPGMQFLSTRGLEAALDDLLAEEDPDLDQLRIVATRLEPLKPSKKLLPAAQLLLASESRDDVLAGIQLAGALAQEELGPPLRRLYVKTLDSRVRTAAKKAMKTIDDLAAVRAGFKPP